MFRLKNILLLSTICFFKSKTSDIQVLKAESKNPMQKISELNIELEQCKNLISQTQKNIQAKKNNKQKKVNKAPQSLQQHKNIFSEMQKNNNTHLQKIKHLQAELEKYKQLTSTIIQKNIANTIITSDLQRKNNEVKKEKDQLVNKFQKEKDQLVFDTSSLYFQLYREKEKNKKLTQQLEENTFRINTALSEILKKHKNEISKINTTWANVLNIQIKEANKKIHNLEQGICFLLNKNNGIEKPNIVKQGDIQYKVFRRPVPDSEYQIIYPKQ